MRRSLIRSSHLIIWRNFKTMEEISGIKKAKYRIFWKSFRTSDFHKSPFVFDKAKAEKIIRSMKRSEIVEEESGRRKKKLRTEFHILRDLEYTSYEIDNPKRIYDAAEYKDRLALLIIKGLI